MSTRVPTRCETRPFNANEEPRFYKSFPEVSQVLEMREVVREEGVTALSTITFGRSQDLVQFGMTRIRSALSGHE